MHRPLRRIATGLLLLPGLATALPARAQDPGHAKEMARSLDLFRSEIRVLFEKKCLECHGGEKVRSDFNLNTREQLLEGGENGPAVTPGDAAASPMMSLVEHREEPFMPKGEDDKLQPGELRLLAEWIDTGAAYDGPLLDPDKAANTGGPLIVSDTDREFWSFRPLADPEPPQVYNAAWASTPIDRFIAAKLEEAGLTPSPSAEPHQLIRRIYFDLIGLPPTAGEVDAFVEHSKISNQQSAIGNLIDRLLASPRFGEKWARHWLDVARFAESHGFEQDYDRLYAYHYRDFVIRAFNDDMPYDQFVRWQLAGDEFAPGDPLAMMATGFLGAGVFPTQLTEKEFESSRYDELDDMAATTGTAFLGLTIGCARCHDHKFDPIPVKDYYQLLSSFTSTIRSEVFLPVNRDAARRELEGWQKKNDSLMKSLRKHEEGKAFRDKLIAWLDSDAAIVALDKQKNKDTRERKAHRALQAASFSEITGEQRAVLGAWYGSLLDAEWKKRKKAISTHAASKPPAGTSKVQVTSEGVKPMKHHADGRGFPHFYPATYHLTRGDVNQKQEEASQGFLQVLMRNGKTEDHWREEPPAGIDTSWRRRSMANWITDTDHGAGHLLARVIVNRLWHQYFGSGLVATPSDFGLQGQRPTHPKLLDYLAQELIRNDWQLKPLHRQILMSSVYRQGGAPDPGKAKIDPENRLLWRFPPRRLQAENLRDSLLALSGELDETMFGPGSLDPGNPRRSIYLMIKRSRLIPMMQVFDSPEPLVSQGDRPSTTVAPQALIFMNNEHVRRWVDKFASRLDKAAPDSLEEAIQVGYRMALGRAPSDIEFQSSFTFLEDQLVEYKHAARTDARLLALGDFCQVLVSLNEFAYLE